MILFSQYKHGNELLDALYQAETPVALGVLMDKLHLSRRSIMYIMENVNRELMARQFLPIGNIKGMGIFCQQQPRKHCRGRQWESGAKRPCFCLWSGGWTAGPCRQRKTV